MIPSRRLLTCLAFTCATTLAFAEGPAANPAPPTTAPLAKSNATNAPAAMSPPPAPAPAASGSVTLEAYMNDLATTLNLSAEEKKDIQSYYVADGVQLQKVLNDDALSPMQQAQQVSEIRDARNAKIAELLDSVDRQHAFLKIEAKYRVALTLLAADGQLVAAAAPPAAAK
jgi:hypothetical protein